VAFAFPLPVEALWKQKGPKSFTSLRESELVRHHPHVAAPLLHHNADPKPFVWTKCADAILKKERRAFDALDAVRGNQVPESEH